MCNVLQMTLYPLACVNHKVNSVKKYHRFLNIKQAIAGQDRGIHEVFIQNTNTYQYAWNSAPIDDTNVMRIIAAV